MKIQSINSFVVNYNSRKNKQEVKRPSFINFQAIDVNKLKKSPLDMKLTYMFTTLEKGDLLVVGSSLREIYSGVTKTIDKYNDIIKRLLFVKHGGLAVPLAFTTDDEDSGGEIQCINIGEKPIILATSTTTEEIEPNSASTIVDGDVIIDNRVNIPVQTKADLSEFMNDKEDLATMLNPENFATETHNFQKIQKKWIEKANESTLKSLFIKAKPVNESKKITFDKVGGMDNVIEELKKSVVYPIRFPKAHHNVELNKGIILYGPPGTGKTLVAEALAGEVNAHFIKRCCTDMERSLVGETEAEWRKIFDEARENQPSIIFIDEFEAVVKKRGNGINSGYADKVVNQILYLMNDLEKNDDQIFVIATTNQPDLIDSAMIRSGRFGKHIEVPCPDEKGLKTIWEIHTRNKNIDKDLDLNSWIKKFYNAKMTGADIKHITNEAHMNSWTRNGIYEKMENCTLTDEDIDAITINNEDIEKAFEQVIKAQSKKHANKIGY